MSRTDTAVADAIRFFCAWIRAPRCIAAVAPSSPALASLMTAEITPASAPVVELGPGTGVFTQALLERGVPEHKLALVEIQAEFARLLESRFPLATICVMDAARLCWAGLFDDQAPGAVLSGLPLLSMPTRKVVAILSGAFAELRSGGAFYQFTYGLRCPIPRVILDRLGLRAARVGGTFANLPPVSVYRIRRRLLRRSRGA